LPVVYAGPRTTCEVPREKNTISENQKCKNRESSPVSAGKKRTLTSESGVHDDCQPTAHEKADLERSAAD
jgi:hypothetical protein